MTPTRRRWPAWPTSATPRRRRSRPSSARATATASSETPSPTSSPTPAPTSPNPTTPAGSAASPTSAALRSTPSRGLSAFFRAATPLSPVSKPCGASSPATSASRRPSA
uniref:Uncharacterized protein n=1 Tax=Arundo donax TaxID=35708 RepID=A0A0A8YMN0_ARUDO